jgi:hypothetical protein
LLLETCRERNVDPSIVVHASKHNRKAWDGSDSMQRAKVLQVLRTKGVRVCEMQKLTAMGKRSVLHILTK